MTLPRPFATLRLLLVLALTALAVPLVVSPAVTPAANSARADTGSVSKTVDADWHRWLPNDRVANDPDTGFDYWEGRYDEETTPSVTVDRTTNLGDEVVNVSWQNFTPSSNDPQYAEPLEAGATPTAVPFRPVDDNNAFYGVDIFECRGTNPTANPKFNDALGDRAECNGFYSDDPNDGPSGPNNRVKAVTQNDGTGFAQFHVENESTNTKLLGCSPTQPCSLVVVANQGGSFDNIDPNNVSTKDCDDHSFDFFRPQNIENPYYASTDGRLSPCSWAKRIVVPLSFSPIAASCPDSASSFSAAGSPSLQRGLNQLIAGWCVGRRAVNFDYNFSVTESNARDRFLADTSTGLTSDTDVGLTSLPADSGSTRPFAYAPIANDAVSIPYLIDNVRTGRPMTDLRLSARLVAKLLTQSYAPPVYNCKVNEDQGSTDPFWCGFDVRKNPATIFDDPEFQKLNFRGDHPDRDSFPGGPSSPPGSQQGYGSFFPTVVAGESDATSALTRWIMSDEDANDFMRGAPDPFEGGMRVNPNYRVKGGSLFPTSHIDALDPGFTARNVAYAGDGIDPRTRQGMQGTWTPVISQSLVAATMLRGRSTAQLRDGVCDKTPVGVPVGTCVPAEKSLSVRFPKTDPEPIGVRDLTGITDNTDAQSYGLPTAQLLTAKGTFVAPTRASMTSASAALKTNTDGVTQSLNYDTTPGSAYPLLLPVYAMVPTCGLGKTKVNGIRSMLGHVVSSQTYGDTPGTLTRGLVQLTSKQLADTRKAATLVSTKRCPTTPTPKNAGGSSNNGNGVDSSSSVNSAGTSGGTTPTANGGAPAAGPGGATGNSDNPLAVSPQPKAAKNAGYRLDPNGGRLPLLPILLLVGGLVLVLGPVGWWALATAPGRTARDRLKHLVVGAGGWRR